MFIQLPINKFILKDNKLFINESVIEYENISNESKEILESLISKGAYFSSLLELNSNYNVKTINEKEITSEDYTKYLQECKSLKKECIVETAALNYRPLTNIRGLEIMENDTSIARGKNNKLFVEDFRNNRLNEIYRETSDAAIELKYDLIDEVKKGLKRYRKSLDGKTVEEVYSIISDSSDYVKNYFNNKDGFNTIKYYITENTKLTEEDHASIWLKYQNKAEELFENAKVDLKEYEGMFEDFCDAVGNMAKNYSNNYNEDDDEEIYEDCEGTQVDDIADKVDYEVGSLQKPKKPNHIVEMFNVPGTHTFKGFMMNDQGVYARGNYILINESGKIKAVNKKLYEEELNAYGDLIIPIEELDTRASNLVMELNEVFNEYAEDDPLYDFGCRMEEDGIKIFDKNEYFDYNSEEFENGSIDKIVQKYFGPNAYLEPENPVIFTIAGIDTDIDKYRNMF